jgi:radical SAM protein with 4Fe4S-binding SPASM domain
MNVLIENEELFFLDYLQDESKKVIYAPLRSYLALAKSEVTNAIQYDGNSNVRLSFINRLKEKPLINVHKIIDDLHTSNPELSLAITDNCNLRCVYCYIDAGEKHKRATMPRSMIDAVLEQYFSVLKPTERIRISFAGGGEPTHNFKNLVYAVNKAKELAAKQGSKCNFSMATNGCYGDEIRDFIINEFQGISLSFDGPELIQNMHRPKANGKGSFSTVYETAKYFYNSKLNFAFRLTVSNYSVNHLKDIIDFFSEHFPSKAVGMELLNLYGRAKRSENITQPDKEQFKEKLVEILEYAKKKSVIMSNSASTEYDYVRPVFCSSVGIPNWTVSVQGDVLACTRDEFREEFTFGKYDAQIQQLSIDEYKVAELRQMIVLNYEECKDCFCKYHCAGDCSDRRLSSEGLDCKAIREIGLHVLNSKLDTKEITKC